jgi:hypothetical protein
MVKTVEYKACSSKDGDNPTENAQPPDHYRWPRDGATPSDKWLVLRQTRIGEPWIPAFSGRMGVNDI